MARPFWIAGWSFIAGLYTAGGAYLPASIAVMGAAFNLFTIYVDRRSARTPDTGGHDA